MRAVRAMAWSSSRCCETTKARTGPSRSASSADAATKMHPPGREGSVAQRRQASKKARRRGKPRGCLNAGAITSSTNRSEATRSISSCSSSFEVKWAKRPLFESPISAASAERLSPSRPSRAARRKAVSRMRSRVCGPFAMPEQYDRTFFNASEKARSVVFLEPAPACGVDRGAGEDADAHSESSESFVLRPALGISLVDLLGHHRRLEQREAGVEQHRRQLAAGGARVLLHHLLPGQAARQEGRPEGERLQGLGVALLYPVTERSPQIHQRVPHGGHLPVQQAEHPRRIAGVEDQVVVLEVVVDERGPALRRHPPGEPARDLLHFRHVLRARVLPALRPSLDLAA